MGGNTKSKSAVVASSPPLTFKAGGTKKKKNSRHNAPGNSEKSNNRHHHGSRHNAKQIIIHPSPSPSPLPVASTRSSSSSSNMLTVIHNGIAQKRSPFQIKNWIACVLTLDGRDKFTKLLQYTSRLLTWYFAGLAKHTTTIGGSAGDGSSTTSSSLLITNLLNNLQLRQQLYSTLSKRFHSLYTSLVTSRKAFRLGRSVIEWDKLKSMGWGDYLGYMLMHPLAEGAADGAGNNNNNGNKAEDEGCNNRHDGNGMVADSSHSLHRYDTHPIPEEDEDQDDDDEEEEEEDNDESSWNGDEQSMDGDSDSEEKKVDVPSSSSRVKVVSRPDRPKLPSRISSNVGWGPSTTTTSNANPAANDDTSKNATASHPTPARTVSELGREMYKPFPSQSSSVGSYKQLKETDDAQSSTPSNALITTSSQLPAIAATPSWKLIGGTIKLVGLMGFWAFDNISFLTSSGFLDPIRLNSSKTEGAGGDTSGSSKLVAKDRSMRKKRASEWAVRCYFFGVVSGLYVNARALWEHRRGALNNARSIASSASLANDNDTEEARMKLKETEQKHFGLLIALLKSCCDFMVFSNNPGIDLHLKLRGRKNHEGLHCLGGLVSAGTVLYNNFPNAK